jgi:hypothetical protein
MTVWRCLVPQDDLKTPESWEKVAERVSKEQDPKKLTELANVLIEKLDKATKPRRPEQTPKPDEDERMTEGAA